MARSAADEPGSVEQALADLAAGDSGAFGVLFDRYAKRVAGLVRRRLGWKLARKIDPEDVVQSVFKSFVSLQQRREVKVDDSQSLWGLLALMTTRKCGHKIEFFLAACRDVRAEESLAPGLHPATEADRRRFAEALSREPDPQELAVLLDTVTRLMEAFDEEDRQIVSHALQGMPVADISREVGRSERTVQRVLKRLWKSLRAEMPEAFADDAGSAESTGAIRDVDG